MNEISREPSTPPTAEDTPLIAKQPYAAPELVVIESVQGLTQAGGAGSAEYGIFS